MSVAGRRGRGQPLIVLIALLVGWAGARVTSWNGVEAAATAGTMLAAEAEAAEPSGGGSWFGPQSYPAANAVADPPPFAFAPGGYAQVAYPGPQPRGGFQPGSFRSGPAAPAWGAGGQSLAHLLAEFRRDWPLRGRADGDRALPPSNRPDPPASPAMRSAASEAPIMRGPLGRLLGNRNRWSADAWALVRDDRGAAPAAGTLPATYGASQTGAVLRYRLSMRDARKPTAYLRTTSTLGAQQELSAALGLSVRPLAAIPVVGAIEGRITRQAGSQRVQPAIMAITEVPPLALPLAFRAEVYAQGGYVGGRYATAFADGQARIDRSVLSLGRYEARLGAGLWGGVQEGASRLDLGPGAMVSLPLGRGAFGRLAVDWRFRVAGNAKPDSGPALTVAAGF